MNLLFLGLVFHFIYLWSIFDIYFRSPIVHGMTSYQLKEFEPPAERLVLFVADGLRADRIFETTPQPFENSTKTNRAPYLRKIIETRGSFGVSHTRVPTESRPGHVAIIAGLYEDVSAVTKGWKMNPVEFDSVFNQSSRTISFGSPDILPMFKFGAKNPERIETWMYAAEEEDYAKCNQIILIIADAKELDHWVFDKVENLFKQAEKNETLKKKLKQPKLLFFLHLLGLDTNGHAHRPHSPEYIENIRYVDQGIQKMEKIIENFYKDQKTSYIFTADHGMSNIGSHGDGNPDNTRTPLIAWGAGIMKPQKGSKGHDDFSKDWELNQYERKDVRQADIAPLMASLIGIPFPVHSVGVLPIDYLDNSDAYKAQSALINTKQILAQYLTQLERKQKNEPFFKTFGKLKNYKETLNEIETEIKNGNFEKAEKQCWDFISLILEGVRYFQTYDWFFLRTVISFGYLGWMIYTLLYVTEFYILAPNQLIKEKSKNNQFVLIGTFIVSAVLFAFLYIKDAPWLYYAYVFFPIYFWFENLSQLPKFSNFLYQLLIEKGLQSTFYSILYIIGLEVLVFSYFYREVLGLWFITFGILMRFSLPNEFIRQNLSLVNLWTAVSFMTAIFMGLPVELHESPLLFNSGGILSIAIGLFLFYFYMPSTLSSSVFRFSALFQIFISFCILFLVNHTSQMLQAKQGLPLLNAFLGRTLFIISLIFPLLFAIKQCQHYLQRLLMIYLTFLPTIILLSISYETLFYSFYFLILLIWLEMERKLYEFKNGSEKALTSYRKLDLRDLFLSLQFLFFINVAFFGTGNMASVSSFQLSSVYRLMTVFDPFSMGLLLVLKILCPFFLLSAVYGIMSAALELPPFSLFLFGIATTDVMTLNFFFLVRDDGSWLEIGTSISHFVIACLFEVLSILLFLISSVLVRGVFVPRNHLNKSQ